MLFSFCMYFVDKNLPNTRCQFARRVLSQPLGSVDSLTHHPRIIDINHKNKDLLWNKVVLQNLGNADYPFA